MIGGGNERPAMKKYPVARLDFMTGAVGSTVEFMCLVAPTSDAHALFLGLSED